MEAGVRPGFHIREEMPTGRRKEPGAAGIVRHDLRATLYGQDKAAPRRGPLFERHRAAEAAHHQDLCWALKRRAFMRFPQIFMSHQRRVWFLLVSRNSK